VQGEERGGKGGCEKRKKKGKKKAHHHPAFWRQHPSPWEVTSLPPAGSNITQSLYYPTPS